MQIVVVGGGVSGLSSALALARQGHDVTVIERDDTPMPATADEAFEWDRRGAPQVRHSHAFLARLRNLLHDRYPDVYASLLAEGATEMRFGDDLPPTITDFQLEPGDDELVMLACRRTTFEWVLRRCALAEGRVSFRTGVGVDGLLRAVAHRAAHGADTANTWIYENWDVNRVWRDPFKEAQAPALFVSFPSLRDPAHQPGPRQRPSRPQPPRRRTGRLAGNRGVRGPRVLSGLAF